LLGGLPGALLQQQVNRFEDLGCCGAVEFVADQLTNLEQPLDLAPASRPLGGICNVGGAICPGKQSLESLQPLAIIGCKH
jgi:hypothetical protein